MAAEQKKRAEQVSSGWLELSKNPLLLLLLGTLLGSIVVPRIDQQIARVRRSQELRTQKAIAIIKASNDTEVLLNEIMTAFENRFKDDISLHAWNEEQPSFKAKVYSLHEEFNRIAWRWCPEAVEEAHLLTLIDRGDYLLAKQICASYSESLAKANRTRDVAWQALFEEQEFPFNQTRREELRRAIGAARASLVRAEDEHRRQMETLVQIFLGNNGQPDID